MDASKNLNIDDHLHLCQTSKFLTLSTCKLETKSFIDKLSLLLSIKTIKLWLSFFSKVGNLG